MKLVCLFLLVVSAFCRDCDMNPISREVQEAGWLLPGGSVNLRFTCRHRQKAREYAKYNVRGNLDALIEEFLLETPPRIIARRLWFKFKELERVPTLQMPMVDKVYFACFTGETSIACSSSFWPLGKPFPFFMENDADNEVED
ncbi:unnamed protein product [Cylicocyclus nassatus]|uniref:Uncharacterized protein n=1 Tax=Cylicocyclus nassatus TaxID=53992 RepID=A0AA36GRS5_CYLNA|nr:unnamed protein product [Cylicocyclus nassatus]